MSGDALGVLIAAALFAPVVLPLFMIGAAATAITAVAGVIVNETIEYAQRRKVINDIEVEDGSKTINNLVQKLKDAEKIQSENYQKYANSMVTDFKKASQQLESFGKGKATANELERELKSVNEQLHNQLDERVAETKKQMDEIYVNCWKDCESIIDQSYNVKEEMESFVDELKDNKQMQKEEAETLLKDAKAAIDMLKTLQESTNDEFLRVQSFAVYTRYINVQRAFKSENYQGCYAACKSIIRKSFGIANEYLMKTAKLDQLKLAVKAKYLLIQETLKRNRYLELVDPDKKAKVKHDLTKFNPEYVKTLEHIELTLSKITESDSEEFLEMSLQNFVLENRKALEMIQCSQNSLKAFYNKRHTLLEITKHMNQQGYVMDFGAFEGNDYSKDMVVKYINKATKDVVVVDLNQHADNTGVSDLQMGIHAFYPGSKVVDEKKNVQLRNGITQYLATKGILNEGVHCLSNQNGSSDRKELLDKKTVLEGKKE